eukprot:scaffold731_cov261-Pinguiococcus_pyrenoidosus.AAC.118
MARRSRRPSRRSAVPKNLQVGACFLFLLLECELAQDRCPPQVAPDWPSDDAAAGGASWPPETPARVANARHLPGF